MTIMLVFIMSAAMITAYPEAGGYIPRAAYVVRERAVTHLQKAWD